MTKLCKRGDEGTRCAGFVESVKIVFAEIAICVLCLRHLVCDDENGVTDCEMAHFLPRGLLANRRKAWPCMYVSCETPAQAARHRAAQDLIEQCQVACGELIDVTRRAAIQSVLQLSDMEAAGGPPQQGKPRSGEVVF